jgi:hypothetical protein
MSFAEEILKHEDEFLCLFCLHILTGETLTCATCAVSFHSSCTFEYLKRKSGPNIPCPHCQTTPMLVSPCRALDKALSLAEKNRPAVCSFCDFKLSGLELLKEHYAFCRAYQDKIAEKQTLPSYVLSEAMLSKDGHRCIEVGPKPREFNAVRLADRRASPQVLFAQIKLSINSKLNIGKIDVRDIVASRMYSSDNSLTYPFSIGWLLYDSSTKKTRSAIIQLNSPSRSATLVKFKNKDIPRSFWCFVL